MSSSATTFALIALEVLALFLGVSFLVDLLQRRLGRDRILRWLGGRPIPAALKGIALGFVTPFCTYSAIPVWLVLRRAGVGVAGLTAFIVAAPVLGPVLFGALALLFGLPVALAYAGVTFSAVLMLALTADAVGADRYLKPLPALVTPAGGSAWRSWRLEARDAWQASRALVRSMIRPLMVAVVLGAVIAALVPEQGLAVISDMPNAAAVPAAALIGIPIYVDTAVLLPVGSALLEAGAGSGVVIALIVAGAAANLPEFALLTRLVQSRLIVGLVVFVLGVAVAAGISVPALVG